MDDNLKLQEVGKRIREIRISKGMTQNDLAFAAHLSTSNISDIELGKSRVWLTTFIKILEALQVSADSILRPDVPTVNAIYQKEYAELLSDCSPAEMESILGIVKQVKSTLHTPKNNDDY
ncbi:MAG: helix-turn-helix transcriptional regulator [Ruminococcaceae bacterium]|nr:helix-turn-helix transcriptional regulator [Oscillospiraceae bacterium]